jgi:streptogramin lyase
MTDEKGAAFATHGVTGDPKLGLVYVGALPPGSPSILIFDTKTEEFISYPRPKSIPVGGAFLSVDSESSVWATAFGPTGGAFKLNPKTGTYTFYPVPYPADVPEGNQNQYGMVVDSQDNVWIARPGAEALGYLEPKTGKTGNVRLGLLPMQGLNEKDRTAGSSMVMGPPNGRGPRRLAAAGNYVYVALMKSDEVAQVDIRTKEVKFFQLPKGSAAYNVRVDKNGNVWVAANNSDSFYKIDPRTGQVTDFQLPTRGTDLRDLSIDNNTTPPTIWGAYSRSNKMVRLQELP